MRLSKKHLTTNKIDESSFVATDKQGRFILELVEGSQVPEIKAEGMADGLPWTHVLAGIEAMSTFEALNALLPRRTHQIYCHVPERYRDSYSRLAGSWFPGIIFCNETFPTNYVSLAIRHIATDVDGVICLGYGLQKQGEANIPLPVRDYDPSFHETIRILNKLEPALAISAITESQTGLELHKAFLDRVDVDLRHGKKEDLMLKRARKKSPDHTLVFIGDSIRDIDGFMSIPSDLKYTKVGLGRIQTIFLVLIQRSKGQLALTERYLQAQYNTSLYLGPITGHHEVNMGDRGSKDGIFTIYQPESFASLVNDILYGGKLDFRQLIETEKEHEKASK